MKKKTIAILMVIITLLGSGTYYLITQKNATDKLSDTKASVQHFVLSKTSVKETLDTTGTIRSTNTTTIQSKLSGQILDTHFEIGDDLQVGALLTEMDNFDVTLSIATKEATIASLIKQIDQINAQKNTTIKSNYNNANLSYESALNLYNHNKTLFNSGAISKSTLDASETTKNRENNNLITAKSNYESYNYLDDVHALTLTLDIEQLRLDELNNALSEHLVLSPLTGVVTNKLVNPGDQVNEGAILFEIQDLDSLEVTVQISEYEIQSVKLGQSVSITPYGNDTTQYQGTVKAIYPVADISGSDVTITVVIDITDEDRMLKPNFTANLTIITNKKDEAFMVPYESLITTPKGVFLNTGIKNTKPIPVKTGIESEMMIEVISDSLYEGMEITIQTSLNLNAKSFNEKGILPMGTVPGTRKKPTATFNKSN